MSIAYARQREMRNRYSIRVHSRPQAKITKHKPEIRDLRVGRAGGRKSYGEQVRGCCVRKQKQHFTTAARLTMLHYSASTTITLSLRGQQGRAGPTSNQSKRDPIQSESNQEEREEGGEGRRSGGGRRDGDVLMAWADPASMSIAYARQREMRNRYSIRLHSRPQAKITKHKPRNPRPSGGKGGRPKKLRRAVRGCGASTTDNT